MRVEKIYYFYFKIGQLAYFSMERYTVKMGRGNMLIYKLVNLIIDNYCNFRGTFTKFGQKIVLKRP